MPKVGAKTFPFDKDGIQEAKAESRATGQKITAARSYQGVARQQSRRAKARKSLGGSGVTIKDAIKRPGALTAAVGGKPSDNEGKVEQLATSGTPLQKRQALFYENVLKKANG